MPSGDPRLLDGLLRVMGGGPVSTKDGAAVPGDRGRRALETIPLCSILSLYGGDLNGTAAALIFLPSDYSS